MTAANDLDKAIENDDLTTVKRLVEQGADLHQLGEYDATPLANAASLGRMEIVKYLLAAGAEPDMGGCLSSLGLAAAKGFEEVCEVLLAAGAGPQSRGHRGWHTAGIGSVFRKSANNGNARQSRRKLQAY